jgi:predicted benzoate:H+ symporter BenE
LQLRRTISTFVIAFSLHSAALLAFAGLKSLSFSLRDAALFALFLVFACGFAHSLLWGTERAPSFLAGALATNVWFPITVAVFDWAIGGGPSPEDGRFYGAVVRYLYAPEAIRMTLVPAAVLSGVVLGSFVLGIACRKLLRPALPRPGQVRPDLS